MVSETANNVLGALGGFCFAACLAPQIWKLYITRSARDISYAFMALYLTGAILLTIYLFYLEDALVAFIAIVVELGITLLALAAKIYLDRWGPYPLFPPKSNKGGASSSSSKQRPTLKQAVFTDISMFLAGGAGAPFPLVQHSEEHAAQHLLLDCGIQLKTGSSSSESGGGKSNGVVAVGDTLGDTTTTTNGTTSTTTAATTPVVDGGTNNLNLAEQGTNNTSTPQQEQEYSTAINVLSNASNLLKNSLQDAGLELEQSRYRQLSSFKSSLRRRAATASPTDHQMVFIGCMDGYTSLIWYEDSSTLAVDFLAAGEASARKMNEAAQLFGSGLLVMYPGSKIEASVIPRMRKK